MSLFQSNMKMISKSLALLLLLVVIKTGWAQNTNLDYKNSLKVYNLTTFDEQTKSRKLNDTFNFILQSSKSAWQFLHPTIAFQWKSKNNNFHEIELTSFVLGKVGSNTEMINDSTHDSQQIIGGNLTTTAISVRYEYIINFNKTKVSKFVPSIGFGLNPYYTQNKYVPTISGSFPMSETNIGIKTFITPRLTYFMTSKLFIDINIPINFISTYYFADKEDNPIIPTSQRTISTFNYDLLPKAFSGRIGIGLKL